MESFLIVINLSSSCTHGSAADKSDPNNRRMHTLISHSENNHPTIDVTTVAQWSAVLTSRVKSKLYICAGNGWEWCLLHVLSAPLRHGNWSSVLLWVWREANKCISPRLMPKSDPVCRYLLWAACCLCPWACALPLIHQAVYLSKWARKKTSCSKFPLLDEVWGGHGKRKETDSMALIQRQQPFRQWVSSAGGSLVPSLWDGVFTVWWELIYFDQWGICLWWAETQ